MNGLDTVLAAVFAAVWLVPLVLTARWERRLRADRLRARPDAHTSAPATRGAHRHPEAVR